MIGKAYLAADNFLVDRANEAVKVWNWTTGRTRAELSDIIHFSSTVPFFVGEIPLLGYVGSIYGLVNHFCNNGLDEFDGQNEDIKDYYAEGHRKILKKQATYFTGLGSLVVTTGISTNQNILMGMGFLGQGAAGYVMRADYQTPRKDCVRRGLDNLTETIRNYRETLEPISVRVNYQEDRQ
jgi:hypothetical protein